MTSLRSVTKAFCVPLLLFLGACSSNKSVVQQETPAAATTDAQAPVVQVPPSEPVRSAVPVVQISDIFFDFDRSGITPESEIQLKQNAAWMAANPKKNITIQGHCDERGTAEYNMALGERRALSAKEYLASFGIDPTRMTTVSYGEEAPFDSGHNETAWAKNRRAHFVEQ